MPCEQISVFPENKMGRLSDLTGAFHEAGVNIRALSLADTCDFGVLRLIGRRFGRRPGSGHSNLLNIIDYCPKRKCFQGLYRLFRLPLWLPVS